MPSSGVTKNVFAQLIARAVHILCSLLLIRLIVEFLGKESYGAYGFITAIILLFGTIADWGTDIIAVREASQNRNRHKVIFGTLLLVRLAFSLLVLLLVNLIFRFYTPWQQFIVPATIASLVLVFLSLKGSLLAVFQTFFRLDLGAIMDGAGAVLFLFLAALLLLYNKNVSLVMVSWVVATGLSVCLGWILVRNLVSLKLEWNQVVFKRLLTEALPMGTLLLVFSLYNRVDILILQHFKGLESVAVYDLAYKIHGNLVLGAAFLMNTLFPFLSRAYKEQNKNELKAYYHKIFGILTLGGLLVGGIFWILAKPTIFVFTGNQYLQFIDSATALRILVFATFFAYLNHLTGYSLIAFGKQRASLLVAILALVFNVVANIVFIPIYSWIAAAVITFATELFIFLASSLIIWRTIGALPSPIWSFQTVKDLILKRGKIL